MLKSFAECSKCPLQKCEGKVCKTNCIKNIADVEIFYLVDDVKWWDDIQYHAEGHNQKYLITSPVLCKSNETLSHNEFEDVMDICKINANTIIKKCEPRTVIAVGIYSCAVNAKPGTEIIVYRDFEEFTEMMIETDDMMDQLGEDFDILNEDIPNKPVYVDQSDRTDIKWGSKDEPYMFTIPDKYYTDEYRLIDVQMIASQCRVIYIFRNKDNKKIFYEVPGKQNDFYWYESPSTENRNIESMDRLELKIDNYKNRLTDARGYGGDVNLASQHSVDYWRQNKGEAPVISKNALHFDIEVYTYKDKIFPDPTSALYPINAVSFRMNDNTDTEHVYLLKIDKHIDPKIDALVASKKYPNLTVFTSEYTMLTAFISKIRSMDPDFICGWNSNSFDIPYIVGRMKKLNIPMTALSPFGNIYADIRGKVILTGFVPICQLQLYKELTYITLPSYKLDAVAKKEKVGRKVSYTGNLDGLYNNNIDVFVEYSLTDTVLLKGIEDATQHITIQDELRQITTNSHAGASSTLGQAEGLFMTSMKNDGLIARNNQHDAVKEKFPGAYVFDARGGLYEGLLCDFDFTSLYPSIINTWNIGPDTFLMKLKNEDDMFNLIYDRSKLKDKQIEVTRDPIHNKISKKMTLKELEVFIDENEANLNITGSIFSGHDKHVSIFFTVIDFLFKSRKIYKKKMLEAKEAGDMVMASIYNGKQMAYKILANSLYGAMGNEHFRFYNIDIAKSITLAGQELLKYCAVHCDEYLVKRGDIPKFKMNIDFLDKVKSLTDVLYGDTDSIFVYLTNYLKDKGIVVKNSKEVQDEIQKIQNFVNEDSLNPFLALHNLKKVHSMIFLKNEFLFSKYYTLNGKKHYAAKVISQEGKDISFTEIKGLEMKRSEIPSRSQKFLTTVLDIILQDDIKKSDIKIQVDKLVDITREEMMELVEERDNSIVRVVSYSKPLNQYKKLPQHIKAMLMWNCIMGEDFRYGAKGKLWNIQGIDLNKAPESVKVNFNEKFLKNYCHKDLNCICVPEDVDKLPEWFIPDMKKLISYCCDDRVGNLTEPLWKESESILLF